jgi:agmatine deiminase
MAQRDMVFGTSLSAAVALGSLGVTAAGADVPHHRSAREAGYRMPLEADPHRRTLMQWPMRASLYGGTRGLEAVRSCITQVARTIARFESVAMLAAADQHQALRTRIGTDIELWPIEAEDLWCRDSGPAFVRASGGELAVTELAFNGWGNRQRHAVDARIARRVADFLGLPYWASGLVGEGGGIESDGAGTLIAHESSWVNRNRNRMSRREVERRLLEALGADQVIWAPGLRDADITDGHVDAVARFVKPGQVLVQLPSSRAAGDPWSRAAFETYEVLKRARDAAGRALEIIVVTDPDLRRIRVRQGEVVASYANYYVCNGAVLAPEFGDDRADAEAHRILRQLYPGREVVALDIDAIAAAGGGIHCATQQQPGFVA